jgi:hypothetical protein
MPQYGADFCGTGGSIEPFDTNSRVAWGRDEVRYIVGDARCCAAIDEDVEGVRIEDGATRSGVRYRRVSTSYPCSDSREREDSSSAFTGAMTFAPPVVTPLAEEKVRTPQEAVDERNETVDERGES